MTCCNLTGTRREENSEKQTEVLEKDSVESFTQRERDVKKTSETWRFQFTVTDTDHNEY